MIWAALFVANAIACAWSVNSHWWAFAVLDAFGALFSLAQLVQEEM